MWVHQEKFNQPYVEAMGKFWRACNARSEAEKARTPHRECMAARMGDGREADAARAREAGMPFAPDAGVARERTFSVPQLVRAAYGDAFAPSLLAPQPVVRVACPARRRRPTPGLGPRLRTPERRLSSLSSLEARRGLHGPRQAAPRSRVLRASTT